jgi:hypothetical protein
MLPPKKPVMIAPTPISRKELEHLYARRSAIDDLIQSLEEYDQFRMRRVPEETRKTA